MDGPPEVVSVTPVTGAEAEPSTTITLEFSEALDPTTVSSATVLVRSSSGAVAGTLQHAGSTVTFTPDERLSLRGRYQITALAGIADTEGETLGLDFISEFDVREGEWSTPEELTGGVEAELARIGADARGNVLVGWTTPTAHYARWHSPVAGWGTRLTIAPLCSGCYASLELAVNAAGDAVVVYEGDGNLMARRYRNGTWDATGEPLMNTRGNFVVALAPTGEAHVVADDENNVALALHTDENDDWISSGGSFTLDDPAVYQLSVSFDENGNGMAVWPTDAGMRYARYAAANGTWGGKATIAGSDGGAGSNRGVPAVALDAAGTGMAIWRAYDMTLGNGILASQFSNAQGWSTPAPIDNLDEEPIFDEAPALIAAGGDFIAAWSQTLGATRNAYVNRFVAGAWEGPGLRSDGFEYVVHTPALAADAAGNVVLGWAEGGTPMNTLMLARRAGNAWSAGDDPFDTENTIESGPRLAGAASGVVAASFLVGDPVASRRSKVAFFE